MGALSIQEAEERDGFCVQREERRTMTIELDARRRPLRGQSQRGNTLLIVLALVGLMSLIIAALLTFSSTTSKRIASSKEMKVDRFSADGAIKAAVNWAKDQDSVAIDPDLGIGTDCIYTYGDLTVSCAADAGSGSGQPNDVGQVPPEALLMLGARHNEPKPGNVAACSGIFDAIGDWFVGAWQGFTGTEDLALLGRTETSARFGSQLQDGFWSCGTRSRSYNEFIVEGKVVAAGQVEVVSGGKLTAVKADRTELAGGIKARYGCTSNIAPKLAASPWCPVPGTRDDGTPEDSDPARPVSYAQNPTNASGTVDVKEAWKPLPMSGLTVQDKAWFLNEDGSLTQAFACAGADRTIVFKPGWYRNASFLNGFTANPACNDTTFWFAPDPGADGKLLTADDQSGAFLMDFRQGSAQTCHGSAAAVSLWCIGGSNTQNPRVVVGSPDGWSPVNPSGTGSSSSGRVETVVGTATTIDNDLSVKWYDSNRTSAIDNNVATYRPCNIFGLFNCPSIDRAIRMRDFTPKVTSPPISEPGHPRGRLFVDVAYGLHQDNGSLKQPELVIEAVSKQSGRVKCGTYAIQKQAYSGTGPVPIGTMTNAQAEALAEKCGTVDLINGLEVKFQVRGNTWNIGSPTVYLDGVRIRYDSFSGASFPYVDPNAVDGAAAKSDCDPRKPGAQLIFSGESHVYVADGSLEVCAGPYTTSPGTHQSIGVWAVPQVESVKPVRAWNEGGSGTTTVKTNAGGTVPDNPGANPDHAQAIAAAQDLAIGEAAGRRQVSIKYEDWCLACTAEGKVRVKMAPYSPPAGFKVKTVDLRVAYNPNSQCALWCVASAEPKFAISKGGVWTTFNLPRNKSLLQYANNIGTNKLRLYDTATGVSRINLSELASGQLFVHHARATCVVYCNWTDYLEGVELDIALEPDAAYANTPMLIPQYGCIVAHPNYEAGDGTPDCAVMKADSRNASENVTPPFSSNREGYWAGRLSVKGTIYAPSSAIEFDDGDYAYPLATRGIVVRHLRVSGWNMRPGYQGIPVSNNIDTTPAPREATFVACSQSASRKAANKPCEEGQGDVIRAASRVRFEVDAAAKKANIPNVQWWSTDNRPVTP